MIDVPEARLVVAHLAAGRQSGLRNAPATQFAGVKHEVVIVAGLNADVLGLFAGKQPQTKSRGVFSGPLETEDAAADDAAADIGVHMAIDGSFAVGRKLWTTSAGIRILPSLSSKIWTKYTMLFSGNSAACLSSSASGKPAR